MGSMNSITIEQTREEMGLAFEVHRNADMSSIRLSRSKMACQVPEEASSGSIAVDFAIKSQRVPAPKGMLRMEVDFRMAGEPKSEPATKRGAKRAPVVSVGCVYLVDYQLKEGFDPSPRQVKAFKDGNVIFNCWPYFREHLQESIQRMGFPPLTAPFLRVQPKPSKASAEANPKATQS